METVKSELVVGIFTSMLTHGGSVCQYEVKVEEGAGRRTCMVNVKGKLLLHRAERDAQCALSGLVWKEVISRGEMREEGSLNF